MTAIPQSSMIRLVSKLLELSAHEFSFPLAQVLPDVEERRAIVREVHVSMPDRLGAFDPERTYETWSAWHLARHIAQTAALEAETVASFELVQQHGFKTDPLGYHAIPEHQLPGKLGTDAQEWAQAFLAITRDVDVDEDLMIGWFANAIEQGIMAGRDRADRDAKESRATAIAEAEAYLAEHSRIPLEPLASIILHPELDSPPLEARLGGVILYRAPGAVAYMDGAGEGVGPGTEFPNLIAEPVIATAPDGTITEGVGVRRIDEGVRDGIASVDTTAEVDPVEPGDRFDLSDEPVEPPTEVP